MTQPGPSNFYYKEITVHNFTQQRKFSFLFLIRMLRKKYDSTALSNDHFKRLRSITLHDYWNTSTEHSSESAIQAFSINSGNAPKKSNLFHQTVPTEREKKRQGKTCQSVKKKSGELQTSTINTEKVQRNTIMQCNVCALLYSTSESKSHTKASLMVSLCIAQPTRHRLSAPRTQTALFTGVFGDPQRVRGPNRNSIYWLQSVTWSHIVRLRRREQRGHLRLFMLLFFFSE